ncbi:hypothetical protein ACTXT7_004301 [Hymenolepis weldensis]
MHPLHHQTPNKDMFSTHRYTGYKTGRLRDAAYRIRVAAPLLKIMLFNTNLRQRKPLRDDSLFASSMKVRRFSAHKAVVTSFGLYDARSLSVMSKRVYGFLPFYNRPVSLEAYCTHVTHTRSCPSDS